MNLNAKLVGYVEDLLNYKFTNKSLLIEALTHKSFCILDNKLIPHNERLEYLGDAILGLVMAESLMNIFPQDNEGMLSKKRASLINQEILAAKAKNLKANDFLILGPGEKAQGSHLKPRLLASAYEAIIGAIYLDSEFNKVKNWINSEFKKDIENINPEADYEKDYKTRLQELVFKLKLGKPEYVHVSSEGPSHNPEFLVSLKIDGVEKTRATGKSKKMAEQRAAEMLMSELLKDKNAT